MLPSENCIMNDEKKIMLEKMIDFFTILIDNYEEHLLTDGDQEGYMKLTELVPSSIE
jgi:hypothetical protein